MNSFNHQAVDQPEHPSSDEIDLRDIAIMLINGWRWIAVSMATCLALATLYLVASTPSYHSSLAYTETSDGLNVINRIPGIAITPQQAVSELEIRLGSYERFRGFLDQHPDYADMLMQDSAPELEGTVLRTQFRELKVAPGDLASGSPGEVSFSYREDIDGAALLNQYFQWSQRQYTEDLLARVDRSLASAISRNEADMEAHLEAYDAELDATVTRMSEEHSIRRLELQDQLAAERAAERASREERIRTLEVAEEIAGMLGITKPTSPLSLGDADDAARIVYDNVSIGNDLPLYFLGTEALAAEREVLKQGLDQPISSPAIRQIEKQLEQLQHQRRIEAFKSRESDSAFIDAYNQLRQENTLLRANRITADDIHVVEVVNVAYRPMQPEGPGKALVMALAVILGGMLGVMLVMLVAFSRSLRRYRSQTA
ncbi:Wzz/FepE/Etk N-terminal domain-containing protein [Halomonas sp. H33-56]|uniref:Wzz/FepE/Etk N-terminal domain-containing protein n=2 Tax=unclassified Halomonas TaxID=2609666 RepID=A0AAU7KPF4_9GAMM